MRTVKIIDKTMTALPSELSFREKTEIAKQLDKLGADIIELPAIKDGKADVLLVKNIAEVVNKSAVAVQSGLTPESVQEAYECVKGAKKAVINVALPTSPAQMEYMCALKAPKMLEKIKQLVECAKSVCGCVEYTALDASRAEKEFLYKAIATAVGAGADIVTLCDDAGVLDPDEFACFVEDVFENVKELGDKEVCIDVSDEINMSVACIGQAVKKGVSAVKTTVGNYGYADIQNVASYFAVKGEKTGVCTAIKTATLQNVCSKLKSIIDTDRTKASPYDGFAGTAQEVELHKNDEFSTVSQAVQKIGYELSPEDAAKVYDEFKKLAERKEVVGTKELEAIIAAVALQVPSTYKLVSYVINAGNVITATANLCIEKDGKKLNGVYVGDGPIDAAFLAIEQVVGHHFELDDFQIQSVTRGREAMGQALVKLRSDSGKLYSGSGISTDVIGASIKAYLNALNKIAFEENR